MKLIDSMQENDPNGMRGEMLDELRPEASGIDRRGFEWFYQWRLARKDLCLRHSTRLNAIDLSGDGRLCATGSGEGKVRVWDVSTGKLRGEFPGNQASIRDVKFRGSGDSLYVVTQPTEDRTEILELRADDGSIQRRFNCAGSTTGGKFDVSGSGEQLAIMVFQPGQSKREPDAGWMIYHWSGLQAEPRLLAAQAGPGNLAFSFDGRMLAVTQTGVRSIRILETASGKTIKELTASTSNMMLAAFSQQGGYFAAGDNTGIVEGWRLPSWQPVTRFRSPDIYLRKIAFTSREDQVALLVDPNRSGPIKSQLLFLDWPECKTSCPGYQYVSSLELLSVRRGVPVVAISSNNQLVHLVRPFDAPSAFELVASGRKEAWSLAFSPDSRTLAVGYDDEAGGDKETLALWNLEKKKIDRWLTGHSAMVVSVAFAADGSTLTTSSYDGFVRRWNLGAGSQQVCGGKSGTQIKSFALSPDGKSAAYARRTSPEIEVWDLERNQLRQTLDPSKAHSSVVAYSPDGSMLALASLEGELHLGELGSGKFRRLSGPHEAILSLAFSNDGLQLVVGSRSGAIQVRDLQTGAEAFRLVGHTDEVRALAVSPDGKTLASAAEDGTVRLWHMRTGRELLTYRGIRAYALAFSPDGGFLAAAGHDGRVRVWRGGRIE